MSARSEIARFSVISPINAERCAHKVRVWAAGPPTWISGAEREEQRVFAKEHEMLEIWKRRSAISPRRVMAAAREAAPRDYNDGLLFASGRIQRRAAPQWREFRWM